MILFIILLLFSANLIAKRNSVQGVDIVNSSNAWVGFWYKLQNNVVHYFQLKRMNEELLAENARLRNELAHDKNIDAFKDVTARIAVTAIDSSGLKNTAGEDSFSGPPIDSNMTRIGDRKIVRYASYHYIPARVINNSVANDRMNFITLNRGRKDGVEPNMAVVTSTGIVGRVVQVSDNYARVLSVLSEGRTYNARLIDGTEGLINWDAGSSNSVTMAKVPKLIDVRKGDSVFTTGYSIFPEHILVGTVAKIEIDKKTNTKNLRILLNTNFRKLQYVYVVKNELGKEKAELEKQTEKEMKKQTGN